MRESWLNLIDSVLRPARPGLERCLPERERHLAERRRALAGCEKRIEQARELVFASGDGVVGARMTALEREWLRLSRPGEEGGLMDLWSRVAPSHWLDRKRFRDSDEAARLDAAVALAADVAGVEAAEAALEALRAALAPFGVALGARVRWRLGDADAGPAAALLAEPLRVALEALEAHDWRAVALERAHRLEREVLEAASARLPERPLLAADLARAAFVDAAWRAAGVTGLANPTAPLHALWATGYALVEADAYGAALQLSKP